MALKARGACVYEVLRLVWTAKEMGKQRVAGSSRKNASYRDVRHSFAELSREDRAHLAHSLAPEMAAPAYVLAHIEDTLEGLRRPQYLCQASSVILTYNGSWGLVEQNSGCKFAEESSLQMVCATLQKTRSVQALWQEIRSFATDVQDFVKASDYAVCLEVCPKTFAEEHVVRLHFHLFLRANNKMRIACTHELVFKDSRPTPAALVGGLPVTGRRSVWCGAYYCQVEKFGHVFAAGSKVPFRDYLINPAWVLNLLQAEKISVEQARQAVLATCSNVSRHLHDLEIIAKELEQNRIRKLRSTAGKELCKTMYAFKRYQLVTAWEAQYGHALFRYRCLVLDGPSKLGKTLFARSLCPSGFAVLEVTCGSGQEPDVRDFQHGQHGLVLFDEICPQQVLAVRKLFQASEAPVQMACSATNCYSYTVYMHRVRMVLCSNVWSRQCRSLPDHDRNWLDENCMTLCVSEPMYEQPEVHEGRAFSQTRRVGSQFWSGHVLWVAHRDCSMCRFK